MIKCNPEIPLSPPFGNILKNGNGKCLAVETTGTINPNENGAKIIQANCDPSENGQRWEYDQGKELLCNAWKKCVSIPFDRRTDLVSTTNPFVLVQWDPVDGEKRQKWYWRNNQFLSIGMCLTFQGDTNSPGAILGYCYNDDWSGKFYYN